MRSNYSGPLTECGRPTRRNCVNSDYCITGCSFFENSENVINTNNRTTKISNVFVLVFELVQLH